MPLSYMHLDSRRSSRNESQSQHPFTNLLNYPVVRYCTRPDLIPSHLQQEPLFVRRELCEHKTNIQLDCSVRIIIGFFHVRFRVK
jgi:hypothetical protein